MTADDLARIRQIAFGLPGVSERLSHGAPCFFVRNKRPLCYFHDEAFSADGRSSLWCPARLGVAERLVAAAPGRFFRPQPSANGVFSTWVGVYLDGLADAAPQWAEIAELIESAYRMVAPKLLVAALDPGPE